MRGLLSSEADFSANLNKPVRAVSIDPVYFRLEWRPTYNDSKELQFLLSNVQCTIQRLNHFRSGSGRKFMTGDDRVVCLHERVFLGRYRQTVLCEGEGPITCIRWRGRFAAWVSRKVRSFTIKPRHSHG